MASAGKREASLPAEEDGASKRPCLSAGSEALPAPAGRPAVWSRDRQAMCETLPTFRAYQGALYHSGGRVKGVMLSGDMGLSLVSSEVVIFRAPGRAGVAPGGQKRQLEDHSWSDAAVKALVKTKDAHDVIFVHVSSNNGDMAIQLPCPICSLGAFWITDLWATRLDGKISIWCKTQKLHQGQVSWWIPSGTHIAPPTDAPTDLPKQTCHVCEKQTPQLFSHAWMCLNNECAAFFQDGHGKLMELMELTYTESFLQKRETFPGNLAKVAELVPPPPDAASQEDPMWWMRQQATRGMVCTDCGQCLPRVWFRGWKCDHCQFKFFPEMQPVSIQQLPCSQVNPSSVQPESTLERTETMMGPWRVTTFKLDDDNTISHFHANDAINRAPGGSDDLFLALQQDQKLELKRYTLHNRAQADFLAAHYSQNFGMPYKYVVATQSKPFSEAPAPILSVKDRLTWATQQIVGTDHDEYNELLAVGYFAGNKMGFHDDGEKDLGPNVSSLSLGSHSTMSFRVKRKFHQGYTGQSFQGRNILKEQHPIMPNSFLATERAAIVAQNRPDAGYLDEVETLYSNYWNRLVGQQGTKKATRMIQQATSPKLLIKIQLRHGDMVLMAGDRIQKYLEHEVSGIDGLRFALTCREITPPEDMPNPQSYIGVPDALRSRFDGLLHHPYV